MTPLNCRGSTLCPKVGFAGGGWGGFDPPTSDLDPPTSAQKKEVGGSGFDPPTSAYVKFNRILHVKSKCEKVKIV